MCALPIFPISAGLPAYLPFQHAQVWLRAASVAPANISGVRVNQVRTPVSGSYVSRSRRSATVGRGLGMMRSYATAAARRCVGGGNNGGQPRGADRQFAHARIDRKSVV